MAPAVQDVKDAPKMANIGRWEIDMKQVKILKSQEEAEHTRTLYEEVFSEDSQEFVDYYYAEKTKDNKVYVCYEQEQIISMLHLNPFVLNCECGIKRIKQNIFYIVAVATKQEYRHRGYMDSLLRKAMQNMEKEKYPFTFLMPANPEIYRPYQFTYIYDKEQYQRKGRIKASAATARDLRELTEFSNEILTEKYGIYCDRTKEYYTRLQKELKSQNGDIFLLKEEDKLAGYFFYTQEDNAVGEVQVLPYDSDLDFLRKEKVKKPIIMARILCLNEMGKLILTRNREEQSMKCYLELQDSVIEENNGIFEWNITTKGSSFKKEEQKEECNNLLVKVSIDNFTAFLFGYRSIQDCFGILPEEATCFLEKVRPIKQVYLNEIV